MTMTNAKINTIQLQAIQHKGETVEEILVDGEVVNSGLTIDFYSLVSSAQGWGDFFILTCSCGEASCIGLSEDDKIKVTHTDSTIKWHITEPKPERTFVFEKNNTYQQFWNFLILLTVLILRMLTHLSAHLVMMKIDSMPTSRRLKPLTCKY